MARGDGRRGSQVIAIVAVVVLAIVVGVISLLALRQGNPTTAEQTAEPIPTFTLGIQTPTPTPTPTPTVDPVTREAERFLAAASGTLWRATAGTCGGVAPVVERSNDGGVTWTDVTPTYLGIAQVASLDGIAVDAAESVGAVGGCQPQALRTYTNGRYWENYPDALAASRYIDLADPAIVHLGATPVEAPCAAASGLRALGATVAVACDGVPYVRGADEWVALPVADAAALAISNSDVVVASVAEGCAGFTLTRFTAADPGQPSPAGCAEFAVTSQPTAIVVTASGTAVWSGDIVVFVA